MAAAAPLMALGKGLGVPCAAARRPRRGEGRGTGCRRLEARAGAASDSWGAAVAAGTTPTPPATLWVRGEQRPAVAELADASSSAALAVRAPSNGLVTFFAGFLAGGLLFSTAAAAAAAVFALGVDNVKRLMSVMRTLVRHVWTLVRSTLGAVYASVRSSDSSWEDTRRIAAEGFVKARKAAAESVTALKLEQELYAAVVGQPGLVALQYAIDRLFKKSLGKIVEESVRGAVDDFDTSTISQVRKLATKAVKSGDVPPRLVAARVYDVGPDALAFDTDVVWESELAVDIDLYGKGRVLGLAKVPVSLRKIRFAGTLRVVVAPLTDVPPGYGALLISVVDKPAVALDVKVAGGKITSIPWLRSEIRKAILKGVEENLAWPKRLLVPATLPPRAARGMPNVLDAKELAALLDHDPLMAAEQRLAETPALREQAAELAGANDGEAASLDVDFVRV